jgi:ribosomal protein L17
MNQALVDLSKNILDYILNNFSPDQYLSSASTNAIAPPGIYNLRSKSSNNNNSSNITTGKPLSKKKATDKNLVAQQSDDETALSTFSLSINSDMSTALRPNNVAQMRQKNVIDTEKKRHREASTIIMKVIDHAQNSIDTSKRTVVDLLSLGESTTFLQEPILQSPSHSQSITDMSSVSSDNSIPQNLLYLIWAYRNQAIERAVHYTV